MWGTRATALRHELRAHFDEIVNGSGKPLSAAFASNPEAARAEDESGFERDREESTRRAQAARVFEAGALFRVRSLSMSVFCAPLLSEGCAKTSPPSAGLALEKKGRAWMIWAPDQETFPLRRR